MNEREKTWKAICERKLRKLDLDIQIAKLQKRIFLLAHDDKNHVKLITSLEEKLEDLEYLKYEADVNIGELHGYLKELDQIDGEDGNT